MTSAIRERSCSNVVSVSGWFGHSLPVRRPAMNYALSHIVWIWRSNGS